MRTGLPRGESRTVARLASVGAQDEEAPEKKVNTSISAEAKSEIREFHINLGHHSKGDFAKMTPSKSNLP